MCGIFGIINKSKETPNKNILMESAKFIGHRGPDNTGVFCDEGVGFVHTRLSIIDLNNRSNQPFFDKKKEYCLIYNGEIYNFQYLKSMLNDYYIDFETTSDTEVLLYSLMKKGIDFTLNNLNGMFSFAFYDIKANIIYLARDRQGIKPLHLYKDDNKILFGSEIKSFIPWISLEPDYNAITSYLLKSGAPNLYGGIQGNKFFKNVVSVPAGHKVVIKDNSVQSIERYSSSIDSFDTNLIASINSKEKALNNLDELLNKSVQIQLISDAPIGSLCSGGLDSSLITAVAAQYNNNLSIFHVNVLGKDSEYGDAKMLSEYLKLDMKTICVKKENFINDLMDVTYHYEYPSIEHPNCIPFFSATKLVNENKVKAVLSGEGADELFLGYGEDIPNIIDNIRYFNIEPFRPINNFRLLKKYFSGNKKWSINRIDLVLGLYNGLDREFNYYNSISKIVNKRATNRKNINSLEWMESWQLHTVLHRNDSLGMANSIEARFPFLENNFLKYALNLPYSYKIKFSPFYFKDKGHLFFYDKWILRELAKRYLPKKLVKKQKLGLPSSSSKKYIITKPPFKESFISDLFGLNSDKLKFVYEHADTNFKIRLLHLEMWAQLFIYRENREKIVNQLKSNIQI